MGHANFTVRIGDAGDYGELPYTTDVEGWEMEKRMSLVHPPLGEGHLDISDGTRLPLEVDVIIPLWDDVYPSLPGTWTAVKLRLAVGYYLELIADRLGGNNELQIVEEPGGSLLWRWKPDKIVKVGLTFTKRTRKVAATLRVTLACIHHPWVVGFGPDDEVW